MLHSLFRFSFHFLRVWPCFFTVLALCYHFLYFSYLSSHLDHVFFTFYVSDHVFSLFWPSATTFYIFITLVILTMFALTFQVFFTFYVSDHVFSLFWPSATTFYIFLTLVILTMLHSLFRLAILQCNQVVWGASATMWHIFKSLRAILSELQPLFVRQYLVVILTMFSFLLHWPLFFVVLALCYHFLYFSYLGHFDHVALTFQVFSHVWPCFFTVFLCYFLYFSYLGHFDMFKSVQTMFFHCFGICYHFLYFSYLGHFDHVALTFQVFFTFYVSDHVFSLFWPSATTFYIFLTLVILTMLHSLFRLFHNAIRCLRSSATMWHIFKSVRAILSELQPLFVWQCLVVILTMFSSLFTCLTLFFHCFGPLLPLVIFFLPWSFWPCCSHFSGCFSMLSGSWGPLLSCGTSSSLCKQY